jgi:hypothetical protein
MATPTITQVIEEFMSFCDILDDAYWEASNMTHKDIIYDIICVFNHEVSELNKLSIQDHHYPYEIITEGVRRVESKLEDLDRMSAEIVQRTRTLIDLKEVMTNVLAILEDQNGHVSDFR